jgi:hypothetical protein
MKSEIGETGRKGAIRWIGETGNVAAGFSLRSCVNENATEVSR